MDSKHIKVIFDYRFNSLFKEIEKESEYLPRFDLRVGDHYEDKMDIMLFHRIFKTHPTYDQGKKIVDFRIVGEKIKEIVNYTYDCYLERISTRNEILRSNLSSGDIEFVFDFFDEDGTFLKEVILKLNEFSESF